MATKNSSITLVLRIGILLALFAAIATALVAVTEQATRSQIADNERATLLRTLNNLLPESEYDNDLLASTLTLPITAALGMQTPSLVYRARKQGQPVAAIFNIVAPDGYNGKISMLIAIRYDGTIAGVRVLKHKETPGLGDKIELKRADWILSFTDLSKDNPPADTWKVKTDGGYFDQFTGATITPRAVVSAVYKALDYFHQQRDNLFAEATQ